MKIVKQSAEYIRASLHYFVYFCIFEIFYETFILPGCTVQQSLWKEKCFLKYKKSINLPVQIH